MGLLEVLLVVFIILKLIGTIDWSWGLVLLPLWIDIGLYTLIILFKVFLDRRRYY